MPLGRSIIYFRLSNVNNMLGNLTLNNQRKTNNFVGNKII